MTEEQPKTVYDYWIKELDAEDKAHKDWRRRAKAVLKRYTDEEQSNDSRFNILWSNTEVMHSAVYGKTPNPDVRRRFKDKDPLSREISEVMERALSFSMDTYDFDSTADTVIDDYLLAGMGNARVRYSPLFETGEPPVIPLRVEEIPPEIEDFPPEYKFYNGEQEVDRSDMIMGADGPFMFGEPEEELVYAEVLCEPIPWNRFRWQPCKRWEECSWAAIDHYMTKDELTEQFGAKSAFVPLGYTDDGEKLSSEEDGKTRALVHEIFDKKKRKVIVIARGLFEPLAEEDDPLELEEFYPFPKPLFATVQSDKLIPIPDYVFYQDQAAELDTITQRIDKLVNEMKYRGVYDGSFPTLHDVSNADDAEFVAVDAWGDRFSDGRSLDEAIKIMPLDELRQVVLSLYQAREQVKQTIYDVTGLADIMRGSTKSDETLGAQQLKTQFGSMRMSKRQRNVNRWLRDLLRIKAEVIVEHFDEPTLSQITGKEVTPEMMGVMQNDLLRSYKVDIETDSTVTEDAVQERQDRIELLSSITQFAQQVGPAVAEGMVPIEVAKELLLFGVRGFKVGRSLEETLDNLGGDEEQQQEDPRIGVIRQQAEQAINAMQAQLAELQQQNQQAVSQVERLELQVQNKGQEAQAKQADSNNKVVLEREKIQADLDQALAEIGSKERIEAQKIAQKDRELDLKEREISYKYQEPIEATQQTENGMLEISSKLIELANALGDMRAERDKTREAVFGYLKRNGSKAAKNLVNDL
jgi:hypothetical protein